MRLKWLVLTAALAWATSVRASWDAFLLIDGIEGESVATGHERQIDISSFSWGMSNTPVIAGGSGKVNIQDLTIMKRLDKSSPLLLLQSAQGMTIPTATLIFRRAGGDDRGIFLKIKLEEVLVSSYQVSGSSGDDLPTESISLNFTKISFDYTPQLPTGGAGTPVHFGWDLAKGTKI